MKRSPKKEYHTALVAIEQIVRNTYDDREYTIANKLSDHQTQHICSKCKLKFSCNSFCPYNKRINFAEGLIKKHNNIIKAVIANIPKEVILLKHYILHLNKQLKNYGTNYKKTTEYSNVNY